MNSFSRNTMYSLLNQFITVAIPLITFPYVSRVLGPENYGTVNYAISIITLFAIFGGIGLVGYATREIAKNRDNIEKLSKAFLELFLIQLLLTICVFVIYLLFIFFSKEVNTNLNLFLIVGFTLFTNLFTFHWFFMGIEDFKYITTRDAIVKVFFVILIFSFINDKNDNVLYVFLNLTSLILSALLNCWFLIKKIKIKPYKLVFRHHLKPVTLALIMSFISTLTIQLNSVLLGSIAAKENLGYYNVGLKLATMIVNIISSGLLVMLPRLSYLNSKDDTNGQVNIMKKTSSVLMFFSIPASIGLFLYSKQIILLLFGDNYLSAIIVSQITAFCLIIMPLTGILYNYIYSNNKEHLAIITMIISLIVSISISFLLVPKYLFIGAAISFVVVELVKLIIYIFFMKRLKKEMSIYSHRYIKYFLISTFTLVVPYLVINPSNGLTTTISMILSVCSYFLVLFILRDSFCLTLFNGLKTRISKE
ncbi:flippase [Peribacillus frigoritolerans]|uniref:flippase n=1 Tax=Peribacillus frigoritolerans TaxID=450367 RepID=UPI003D26F8D8